MADGENEKLGSFAKKHAKYGTTTKALFTNDRFYKYNINPGDTLQGIALRLGVTMADIKRANNMWTNDSLYLRSYLLIPMGTELQANGLPSRSETEKTSKKDLEVITRQDLSVHKTPKSKSCAVDLSSLCGCGNSSESLDFLSKFDSSLAKIKSSVEKIEQNSGVTEDPSNPLHLLPKKKTQYLSRSRGGSLDSNARKFSDDDPLEQEVVIFSRHGSNAEIKSSFDKLQKTDEELFQL